jgi:ABC-type multidrug transport system fused ATPase/permease subunit
LKKIIKNIFIILQRKEKLSLIRLVLFDVAISVLDICFLAVLLYVIHFYTEPGRSTRITNFPFTVFNKYPLLLIAVFFILYGIKNLLGFQVFRMQFRFVYGVASRLSKNNLMNYLQGSYKDYVDIDSSVHNRKIGQQPIEFGHYILGGFQQIAGQSILIVITIIAILIFSPVLFPLLVLILMPPIVLTGYLIKRRLNTIRKTAKTASERTLQHLQEALSGFVESSVYGSRDFFVKRYDTYQSSFNHFLSEQLAMQNMPSKLIEVFAIFGLFVLILINLYTANTSAIPVITIGAFMAASYKIIPGIVKILNIFGQIKTYEFTVDDLLQSRAVAASGREDRSDTAITSLALENVSFAYRKESVLNNFSLFMASGDFIGISGLSGKGKTTIIHLLLGFIDPSSGVISVNGSITDGIARQQYWKAISYVKQQPFLIHDTIFHNITMNENSCDEERLRQAVEASGLSGLLVKFPSDLQKMISENGRNISGGQRQRIAIARALYKEADLIILDEPFNELDEESELAMLRHFKKLSQRGKMIILVTHNKQSLSFCDKIISLDELNADEKS